MAASFLGHLWLHLQQCGLLPVKDQCSRPRAVRFLLAWPRIVDRRCRLEPFAPVGVVSSFAGALASLGAERAQVEVLELVEGVRYAVVRKFELGICRTRSWARST